MTETQSPATPGTISGCGADAESQRWLAVLREDSPAREQSIADLHGLLLGKMKDMGPAASRRSPDIMFEFRRVVNQAGQTGAELWHAGEQVSSALFDTPEISVGYRFLDVFHLAHAVVLAWSPNTCGFLRPVKSPPIVSVPSDEDIEDAVSVLTFTYASLEDRDLSVRGIVDPELVTQIQSLTRARVGQVTAEEWERAAVEGIAAWQRLLAGGSSVYLDFDQRHLQMRD
jgi:hypothetical protein